MSEYRPSGSGYMTALPNSGTIIKTGYRRSHCGIPHHVGMEIGDHGWAGRDVAGFHPRPPVEHP